MRSHPALSGLVACLHKLPGVGRRSAERMAVAIAMKPDSLLVELNRCLQAVAREMRLCPECGGLTSQAEVPCRLCSDPRRDPAILCVVEGPLDVLRIEQAGGFEGRYHVLGELISPLRGKAPADLSLEALVARVRSGAVREVVLALNGDMESDSTAAYIRDLLAPLRVNVSRPALGMPAGGGIAYLDAVTIGSALKYRQPM